VLKDKKGQRKIFTKNGGPKTVFFLVATEYFVRFATLSVATDAPPYKPIYYANDSTASQKRPKKADQQV